MRSIAIAIFLATGLACAAASAQPARRQDTSASASSVALEVGSGRVIALGRGAASVFAADPKIAEVRPASASSLFVFGVGVGRTTVAAMDAGGTPIAQYEVFVRPSSFAAQETSSAIARQSPGSQVHAESRAAGFALGGTVQTPLDAQRAFATARMNLTEKQKFDSDLAVRGQTQVNLHVKVAEMSRNVTREMGIDWQAIGRLGRIGLGVATHNFVNTATTAASAAGLAGLGKTSFEAVIDALAQDNLVHILAEPNLTALSGESASFIVGGEFPIPVAQQNNTISIEFKQYGISLAFVPTVLDDGQITLKVRPEVSSLTQDGAVSLGSGNSTIQIPALSVRRAETTVTLGSGQSFAIAGLLQDSVKQAGSGLPFLGDIPVLGALFRSTSFQRDETELVIVVTPYIVRPASGPSALQLPTDGFVPANDFERTVLLRQYGRGGPQASAGLASVAGSAGFLLQ